jgi:DNA invertase Pin-like site-specific DNA recombinase
MRVSTSDQNADLQSDSLRAYAKRAGLKVVKEYLDHGVSGKKSKRPQLDRLMKAARTHEFDCIVVWKFDRFARSTKHLLTALEEFNYLNIQFVSVQDQVDTTSPMGKAMFTLIGAMAELESSLIGERVAAGMQAAKQRGKSLGRPSTPESLVKEIERLAKTTQLSVRQIHQKIGQKASRGVVGEITKSARSM